MILHTLRFIFFSGVLFTATKLWEYPEYRMGIVSVGLGFLITLAYHLIENKGK